MSPGSKGESSKAIIQRPSQTTWKETTMNASCLVLSLVQEAASLAPCQELKQAAAAALIIFQTIQAVKENKDAYRRLADDSAGLICTVWKSYKTAESPEAWLSPELLDNIIELTDTLNHIRSFVEEKLARTKVIRVIYSRADLAKIAEYRERLVAASHNFQIGFQIGSHMRIDTKLGNIERILETNTQTRDQEEADRLYEEQLNEAKRISKLEQWKRVEQSSDESSHSTESKNIRKNKKSQRSELEHLRAVSNSLDMKNRLRKEQEEKVREEEEILQLRRKLADQEDSTTSQAQAQKSTKTKKRVAGRSSNSNSSESPRRQPVTLEDSADDDEEYMRSSKMRTARQKSSNTPPRVEQTDEEEDPAPPPPRKSSKGNGKPKHPPEPPNVMNNLNAQFQGMGIPLGNNPYCPPFPMYGSPFSPPPYGFGYGGSYPPGTTINSGVGNVTHSTILNCGNDNSVRKVYRK